jgi:hypothetical protein
VAKRQRKEKKEKREPSAPSNEKSFDPRARAAEECKARLSRSVFVKTPS